MGTAKHRPTDTGARIKRSFAQSTYITAAWNWFLILAGKAAEPVLVASVLYASVKLLPMVHFPAQDDVAVFIAQFVALDIGGLSLNKLADQAKKDGNEEGAMQAKRLSIALVAVMLIGVIMAGVDQIVKLDGQVGTVIETILVIARAVMAVLYSRVIHRLKKDEEPEPLNEEQRDALTAEKVKTALLAIHQESVAQLTASVSQLLEERLMMLDRKQAETMAHLKEEQARMITEMLANMGETVFQRRRNASPGARETRPVPCVSVSSPNLRSIPETASKRATGGTGERKIDQVVWPLLETGLSVRAIAAQTATSTATVGRSRKRWVIATKSASASQDEPLSEAAESAL